MKQALRIILLSSCIIHASSAPSMPPMGAPIHLFKERDLALRTGLIEDINRVFAEYSKLIPSILATVCSKLNPTSIGKETGRQVPQIGYDDARKIIYTGASVTPCAISLTFSGSDSLEKTVASLETSRFAHNFIIDIDGTIHPVTKPGETVQEALLHRPFALGITNHVTDGYLQNRDMNSLTISISVVGDSKNPSTLMQNTALKAIIAWLQKEYNIRPDQVVDYGLIAFQDQEIPNDDPSKKVEQGYTRRQPQPNLCWPELAAAGLAVWPKPEHMLKNSVFTKQSIAENTTWASGAFNKVGLACPHTSNPQHHIFVRTLTAFQKHYRCDSTMLGQLTEETLLKLNSVLWQHEQYNPNLQQILPPSLKSK